MQSLSILHMLDKVQMSIALYDPLVPWDPESVLLPLNDTNHIENEIL